MPYCPKCGVEVDSHIEKCPLCTFHIPDVGEVKNKEARFPTAENIYPKKIDEIRNAVYFTLTVLSFVSIIILATIYYSYGTKGYWIKYSVISILSGWLYFYFLLGYVTNIQKSVMGISFITLLLTLGLDGANRSFDWSIKLALPMIITFLIVFLILEFIYKKINHPINLIFIISYSCIGLAVYSIGLQSIISLYFYNKVILNWSIIVFLILVSLAIILLGVYYKLPDQVKEKLKRKFHI